MPSNPDPKRGEIVRVRLDPVEGSEQGGDRPALVLSPDIVNVHSPVVLVASIASRKTGKVYPFEAGIQPPDGGLKQPSKVMLMQLRSIDKSRICGRYGTLAPETMRAVDDALRIAAGLAGL